MLPLGCDQLTAPAQGDQIIRIVESIPAIERGLVRAWTGKDLVAQVDVAQSEAFPS